jgi:hypothetical protein
MVEIRTMVQGPISTNKLRVVVQTCDPSSVGGGSWFEANLGKMRKTLSKKQLGKKGLGLGLKWQSTCLASTRSWLCTPVLPTRAKLRR